jgi:two-component system response regulator NreC
MTVAPARVARIAELSAVGAPSIDVAYGTREHGCDDRRAGDRGRPAHAGRGRGATVRAGMVDAADSSEQRVRIVLADDHSVLRSGLRLLLDAEPGFEVVAEAGNAQDAARYVRGHKPDVLILDLNMPGGSGLDLIPLLKEEAPGTRVVVLTMQRDPAFARQALGAGAVGYVLKDAADGELALAVRLAASGQTYLNPQLGARLAAEPVDGRPGDLSDRELEILRLIALGHTNPEIAGQLYLSVRTIEAHRSHIHQKLRLASRAELVRFALEHRLVELPDADS